MANLDRCRGHDGPVQGRRTRPCRPQPAGQPPRQQGAQDGEGGPHGRPQEPALGDPEPVLRIRERARKVGLDCREGGEDRQREGADEAPVEELVPAERVDDSLLDALHLHVDLDGDPETGDERQRVLERRCICR